MERVCSQTQLCQLRCFNDYTRQLHVSAPTGHLQVVFKRNYGSTIYIYIYIYSTTLSSGCLQENLRSYYTHTHTHTHTHIYIYIYILGP